jgi:DNA/RNA endonuclease G (NUC1)
MRFWKIVARVENGTLKTTALIADQTSNITVMPAERIAAENFDDLGEVKQYQTTVKAIEQLTGLDFGEDMRNADTAPAGPESIGAESVGRELRDFTDVRLG